MSFKLDPNLPLAAEIARALREQLAGTIELLGQRRATTAKRIHKGRTAGKKIRALLKLIRTRNPAVYRRENRRIRDAARALSGSRDADVRLDCLAALLEYHAAADAAFKPAPFAGIRRALIAHRQATALSPKETAARLRLYLAALRKTDTRLRTWKPRGDFSDLADDFRRSYRRARRAFTALKQTKKPKADAFHEWRKASKAYSHHCRLLRAAWPAPMKELLDELRTLARLLGDEHDLTVLLDTLRQLATAKAPGLREATVATAFKLIESRRAELRTEALALGARLYVDKPRTVKARLTHGWSAARETDDA